MSQSMTKRQLAAMLRKSGLRRADGQPAMAKKVQEQQKSAYEAYVKAKYDEQNPLIAREAYRTEAEKKLKQRAVEEQEKARMMGVSVAELKKLELKNKVDEKIAKDITYADFLRANPVLATRILDEEIERVRYIQEHTMVPRRMDPRRVDRAMDEFESPKGDDDELFSPKPKRPRGSIGTPGGTPGGTPKVIRVGEDGSYDLGSV